MMGMFDSLIIECPNCGKKLEFQSKSGPCTLMEFNKWNLPTYVACGMGEDTTKCENCGKEFKLHCNIPQTVNVELEES